MASDEKPDGYLVLYAINYGDVQSMSIVANDAKQARLNFWLFLSRDIVFRYEPLCTVEVYDRIAPYVLRWTGAPVGYDDTHRCHRTGRTGRLEECSTIPLYEVAIALDALGWHSGRYHSGMYGLFTPGEVTYIEETNA